MAKSRAASVDIRVINLTGPTAIQPSGIPAGVVGTSNKGVAFVPMTVATAQDFVVDFGAPTDDKSYGPMASIEWLRNAQSLTFLKVLGAGAGLTREVSTPNSGRVRNAGFVVGSQLPQNSLNGGLSNNPYASGNEGRTFILGCFMKETTGATVFQDAGKPTQGVPLVRAVLMAPSGVYMTLSGTRVDSSTAGTTGTPAASKGALTGSINISGGRQEFVVLLNGHNNSDPAYKNIITASFDPTAPNYLGNVFNTDPFKIEQAGHYLYADWKINSALAVPSGAGVITPASGAGTTLGNATNEEIAFILTSSVATRNSGSTTVPNFENFEDRYETPESMWVVSQRLGGKTKNLFRVFALDDGVFANDKFKVSIENIVPGTDVDPYCRFDLLVRDLYDTDKNQVVFEAWRGLSLNPSSPQYISRIIGDTHNFYNFDAVEGSQKVVNDGDFANISRYVRIEVASEVDDAEMDPSAVPFGFRGAPHLVTSGTSPMPGHTDASYFLNSNPFYNLIEFPVPFRETISRGSYPNKTADKALYWGVQFEEKVSVAEPNSTTTPESNIKSFTKYFPNFHTDFMNVVVDNNEGVADTAANGTLDADRFLNNAFSLSNVRIALNSNTDPDLLNLSSWVYVRAGNISTTSTSRSLEPTDLANSSVRNVAKFTLFVHGGFDGVNIFDKPSANITNQAVTEEMNFVSRGTINGPSVVAYNKALDIMADTTEVDLQILAVPGIRNSVITDKGLQITENRFDAMFVMDVDQYDNLNILVSSSNQIISVANTTEQFSGRGINTSFGAAYFPDVVLRDSFTGKTRIVPPSVAAVGVISKNDAVGFPWFAPAGFNRGGLDTAERAALQLSKENMDALQEVNINPIVAFASSGGDVVWGQKTLLQTESSLERINVRRLLIDIRRKVKAVGQRMLFEPNREETLARFSSLVVPIMKDVQDKKGVSRFLVKIDTTTTTVADIQNRTIRGKIFLAPIRSLEFISLDFIVSNTI